MLHRDELVLAGFIADSSAIVPENAGDADRCAPLFTQDFDIGNVFRTEYRFHHAVVAQMAAAKEINWMADVEDGWRGRLGRIASPVEYHLFQPDATSNLFAAQADALTRASAFGAPLPAWSNPFATLRALYNPVGKTLVFLGQGGYDPYIPRAQDVAALQRLVRLSYEIRHQGIGVADIPAFLAQHAELSTHPADHRPFLWDATALTLRIQLLEPPSFVRPERPFLVHVWQKSATN
jgi:hypothetical protein